MVTGLFKIKKFSVHGASMVTLFSATTEPFSSHPGCIKGTFLNFPTWYKYLDTPMSGGHPTCNPAITGLNDFWLIGLAVIEILLRIGILVAIIYVLLGGLKFITARGDSERINQGRTTAIDALVGLVIAIIATAGISYIAGKFSA